MESCLILAGTFAVMVGLGAMTEGHRHWLHRLHPANARHHLRGT
jgi:hypothetical protein